MEKKYVLAVDQSTQGTKAILFDVNGDLVCRTDLPHRQLINEKGWVSHDLSEIYSDTIQVVKNLVEKAGIQKEEIACLGISNQRETSAAWSRSTGEPLAPAIVWQCSRASEICERIKTNVMIDPDREQKKNGGVAEIIRQKTGMHLSPYFPAAKFAWLQENVEEVKQAKRDNDLCLGTIDTWLLFKLTKGEVYATDYSNASRTQLFNIHNLKWDKEICTWFGINAEQLPKVCDSSREYGMTDFEGYFQTPIPICGVIGDSQGALFGQGCIEKGMVKATYGTGSSVMMNAGTEPIMSDLGLVTSLAWGLNGKITYQITDIVEMMKAEDGMTVKELCVDGGPTRNQYLMKFQSDILGTTVSLPRCEESSAFGAGLMAGLSCGLYKMESIFEVKNRNQFIPSMNAVEREQKYSGWKNAVEKVLV